MDAGGWEGMGGESEARAAMDDAEAAEALEAMEVADKETEVVLGKGAAAATEALAMEMGTGPAVVVARPPDVGDPLGVPSAGSASRLPGIRWLGMVAAATKCNSAGGGTTRIGSSIQARGSHGESTKRALHWTKGPC